MAVKAGLAAFGAVISLMSVVLVGGAATFLVGAPPTATAAATASIPAAMLTLYETAATTCPGLPWTVLAAIGTVESDNGQSNLPGVHSGANAAGAEGPMQFEPATFAAYDEPVPPGGVAPPSPYDPVDAVYGAARFLCANGASGGVNVSGAIYDYNHSSSYVAQVLALAQSYGGTSTSLVPSGSAAGEVAAEWAMQQIGTPYVWGGETVGVGFDCSGLVQPAYAAAGEALPRVAQDQYDATPGVPAGSLLEIGDLVFFGSGPTGIDHVGIYVGVEAGQSVMVDAPHTGADVRVEPFPTTVGAAFGDLLYMGATRPA
jgi:cell wall-associated NlpC family hydrolase